MHQFLSIFISYSLKVNGSKHFNVESWECFGSFIFFKTNWMEKNLSRLIFMRLINLYLDLVSVSILPYPLWLKNKNYTGRAECISTWQFNQMAQKYNQKHNDLEFYWLEWWLWQITMPCVPGFYKRWLWPRGRSIFLKYAYDLDSINGHNLKEISTLKIFLRLSFSVVIPMVIVSVKLVPLHS